MAKPEAMLTLVEAPASARFRTFWPLLKVGLPLASVLAGGIGVPLWATVLGAVLLAVMAPELWPLRTLPSAVLRDRMTLPRALIIEVTVILLAYAALTGATFHTVGRLFAGWVTSAPHGLQSKDVLIYGIVLTVLSALFGLTRRLFRKRAEIHLAEATRREREAHHSLRVQIDPRLLVRAANVRPI